MRMLRSVALAAGIAGGSAAAQTHVSDGTFNDVDWTHRVLWSLGTVTLGPMVQAASGGNPGSYQQGRHTSTGAFATIYDGHLFTPGVHDPATQGAIQSVDIRYDLLNLDGLSIQNGFLVLQGGRTYFRYVDSNEHAAWTSVGVNGITDTDNQWQEATPGGITQAHPDFSSAGAAITFGYYTFNWSLPQGFFIERRWGVDNFDVTIHGSGPAPCYANCDGSTGSPVLNVNDFVCFQTRFAAGEPYADCDQSGGLNVNDFVCFQQRFAAGCP